MAANPKLGSELLFNNVTLTANYVDNQVDFEAIGKLSLLVDYTQDTETSVEVQLQVSHDGITYFLPTNSAGAAISQILQMSSTGKARFHIPERVAAATDENIGPILAGERFCRLRVKATGGTTLGSVTVILARDIGQIARSI